MTGGGTEQLPQSRSPVWRAAVGGTAYEACQRKTLFARVPLHLGCDECKAPTLAATVCHVRLDTRRRWKEKAKRQEEEEREASEPDETATAILVCD